MNIVLASNNKGKIKEINALLKDLELEVLSQQELAIPSIEETGCTFVENALLKARHAAMVSNLPALADDSGIVVPSLNGAPGIYSARYAGEEASDADNIKKLLADLAASNITQREAYFFCVIVFISSATDPTPLICQGKWHGKILETPIGTDGFGYDPVFYIPALNKTAAELPIEIKNQISHRGQALKALINALPEKL